MAEIGPPSVPGTSSTFEMSEGMDEGAESEFVSALDCQHSLLRPKIDTEEVAVGPVGTQLDNQGSGGSKDSVENVSEGEQKCDIGAQNDGGKVADLEKWEEIVEFCETRKRQVLFDTSMTSDVYNVADIKSNGREQCEIFPDSNRYDEMHESGEAGNKAENNAKRSNSFDESEEGSEHLKQNKEEERVEANVTSLCDTGVTSIHKKTKKEALKFFGRRGKSKRNCSEVDNMQNESSLTLQMQHEYEIKGEGAKIKYSRGEMEAIGFVNVAEQQERWNQIYGLLTPKVAEELNQIFESDSEKQGKRNVGEHDQYPGKKINGTSGKAYIQSMDKGLRERHPYGFVCDDNFDGINDNSTAVEEAYEECEDSDDESDTIQRPAFYVEGEPDFESGPPQDGLEYLRRVRWEAEQIPKVKVANICSSKINKEQTPYMPKIPEIRHCPPHLLPSKEWEDAFLEDFSQLRQAIAQVPNVGSASASTRQPGTSREREAEAGFNPSQNSKDALSLSSIMAMDTVSRASTLRNRIQSFETASTLSKETCLWLFALCAAVDTPFHADLSASIRSLLRKCSDLRAEKVEFDDELVMLNILVTVTGRYFGQAEC